MEEITRKWLLRAKYDLNTAKAMLAARRYLYVTFMCQQSLEKILKAIIIDKGKDVPRTHNLTRLAEITSIYNSMPDMYQDFLADITPFAIEARYGDYKKSLSEITDKKMAMEYLGKTKEIFKWLQRKIRE